MVTNELAQKRKLVKQFPIVCLKNDSSEMLESAWFFASCVVMLKLLRCLPTNFGRCVSCM